MGNIQSAPHNLKLKIISDKQEAQSLLDKAEKIDFYLEECHDDKVNSISRHKLTYIANGIPLRDLTYSKTYIESVYSVLPIRLLTDLDEVKIVQLMPTADGGMPHTRPDNIICYPIISQLFSNTTLIHELWHVHQRKYKDLWLKTFSELGWTLWNGNLPPQLENMCRYNPDTIDCPFWIFDNKWVPLPIFRDVSRPNVAEVDIWYYNSEKKYHVKEIPSEISSYFPNLPSSAYEHPREITAYMLSEPNKYKESKGFEHLIKSIGEISIRNSKNIII